MIATKQSHGENTKEAMMKLVEALESKKKKSEADDAITGSDEDSRGEALLKYIESLKKKP